MHGKTQRTHLLIASIAIAIAPILWAAAYWQPTARHAVTALELVTICGIEWLTAIVTWMLLVRAKIDIRSLWIPQGRQLALTVAAGLLVSIVVIAAYARRIPPQQETAFLVMVAIGAPTAGLVEEFLYRAVGTRLFGQAIGNLPIAIAVSGVAFALLHEGGGIRSFGFHLVFALAMTGLYYLPRNLAAPILLHWTWDALAAAMLFTAR